MYDSIIKNAIKNGTVATAGFHKYLAKMGHDYYADIEQYRARYNELAKLFENGTVCIDCNGTKHILSDSEQFDVANSLLSLYQWKIDSTLREVYIILYEHLGFDKIKAEKMAFEAVQQIKLKEHMEEISE